MRLVRKSAMLLAFATATLPTTRGTAQQLPHSPSSEAELRERITAEVMQAIAAKEQAKELDDARRALAAMKAELAEAKATAAHVKQDAAVQPATTATTPAMTTQVATGPVAGVRYQVPAQWVGTAAGYVINYAGYKYLVGTDGTMTYYTGATYDPALQPTTYTGNTLVNHVQPPGYSTATSSTYPGGPTTTTYVVYRDPPYTRQGPPPGYWPGRPPAGPSTNQVLIEQARARQAQLNTERAWANALGTLIRAAQ